MSFQNLTTSLFNNPPSPPTSQPCTPSSENTSSGNSDTSDKSTRTIKLPDSYDLENSSEPATSSKIFGTPIQRFAQELTKSLSRFSVTEKLSDKNFVRWAQPVKEALMSMDYLPYIKKRDHRDSNLTTEQHSKVKFIITTWMLSLMDPEKVQRSRVHLTVRSRTRDDESSDNDDEDSDDELSMTYEPAML